jgi:hypothetical protein
MRLLRRKAPLLQQSPATVGLALGIAKERENRMFWIKKIYTRLPISAVVDDELHEARLALLKAQSAQEFATSAVSYNQARVNRLEAYEDKGRELH